MSRRFLAVVFAVLCATCSAWSTPKAGRFGEPVQSRADMLKTTLAGAFLVAANPVPASAETVGNGVTYEVLRAGDGPKPEIGELIAIRFKAFAGSMKIDDIFDSPEPYYTRLGSGALIKGVETTLPLMRVGDRWKLTIPVSLSRAWTVHVGFAKRSKIYSNGF